MLSWVVTFLIIAVIAGVFGFTGISAAATGFARTIFSIAILVFVVTLVAHVVGVA